MFEILGYLREENERTLKNIDKKVDVFYDFLNLPYKDVKNSYVIIPPFNKAVSYYIKANTVIISTDFEKQIGAFSFDEYKNLLTSLNYKDKLFVELNLFCDDFDIMNRKRERMSVNRGILNSYVKKSFIFFDEASKISYFTHKGHLVWINDPKSVSLKHNLIKKLGFKGVFIRDVDMAIDGNWDSLFGMKKAQNN